MGKEQGDYLSNLGKRTAGTTWVSQLMQKVWKLKHSMWLHRDSFVHKEGKSMPQHEEGAINRAIKEEFIIGRDKLLMEHAQWIYRVWSGRD